MMTKFLSHIHNENVSSPTSSKINSSFNFDNVLTNTKMQKPPRPVKIKNTYSMFLSERV